MYLRSNQYKLNQLATAGDLENQLHVAPPGQGVLVVVDGLLHGLVVVAAARLLHLLGELPQLLRVFAGDRVELAVSLVRRGLLWENI